MGMGHDAISRRSFVKTLGAGAASTVLMPELFAAPGRGGQRPDVLFIAIEDVSPHRFGCWGNAICKTPHIDRLVSQGLRFDQAHCNAAVCNPSRTALLTCLRPDTTKVYGNRDNWQKLAPQAQSMPAHFRKHGYETVRIGKVFHAAFEHKASWSRVIKPNDGLPKPKGKGGARKGPGVEYAKLVKAGKAKKRGSPFIWSATDQADIDTKDGRYAEQAIRVLAEQRDKPLFLALGQHATHLAWAAPKKYFDMYPPAGIPLPKLPADERKEKIHPDHKALTPETWREAIAAHYACLTFIDAQVGRVLDALEKSGRADNTIVVLWSDHGYMLGEHYLWRKPHMYDTCTRVALTMKAPGVTKPGSVCERPVETFDIFPTLFDLCGIPQPESMEAVSMRPLLADPQRQWRPCARTEQGTAKSVRTERWRYTERKSGRTELFDYATDPEELHNLAGAPKHAEREADLRKLLHASWRELLPRGA